MIISADLEPYLSSLVINTKFDYAPFRVKKVKKGETRRIYPDHYPIVIKFKNMPTRQIKLNRVSNLNLNVPEGCKIYEFFSNTIAKEMNNGQVSRAHGKGPQL